MKENDTCAILWPVGNVSEQPVGRVEDIEAFGDGVDRDCPAHAPLHCACHCQGSC